MGITTGAALLGCGACAKGGMKAASLAMKAGRARAAGRSRCTINSFTPDTPVLMADGTQVPIAEVQVGDLVWTTDPVTGEVSAQPVLDTITGYGDKHLYTLKKSVPTPHKKCSEWGNGRPGKNNWKGFEISADGLGQSDSSALPNRQKKVRSRTVPIRNTSTREEEYPWGIPGDWEIEVFNVNH